MAEVLNSGSRIVPTAQIVVGTCTVTAGVPALTQLSGVDISDQVQVSVSDDGTGLFTVSVTNFRGPNSYLIGKATAIAASAQDYTVSVKTQSYTAGTDTANFTFNTLTGGSAADGASFNFILWAV